jgi:hypothetical protein
MRGPRPETLRASNICAKHDENVSRVILAY